MANTFQTPLMELDLPIVQVQIGPDYAADINTALERVDEHDHTAGFGKQVPVAGINIDADLSFNSFNADELRSSRYDSQSSALADAGDVRSVYSVGGDLYWNNAAGVAVQITSGTGLNLASVGTIGGDYGQVGVPATVTYSDITKTFIFLQSAGIGAKMFMSDIGLVDDTSGAQPITIKATNAVTAYNLTLPDQPPVSQGLMAMSTGGVVTATPPNSTYFSFSSNALQLNTASLLNYVYFIFTANGTYRVGSYVDGERIAEESLKISNVYAVSGSGVTSGTTEADVLISTTQDGSGPWTSIFSTTPKFGSTALPRGWCGVGDTVTGFTAPVLTASPVSLPSKAAMRMDILSRGVGGSDLAIIVVARRI